MCAGRTCTSAVRAGLARGVNGQGARELAVRRRRVVVYQFEHSASVWPQGVVVLRDVGAEVWRLKRDNHSGITVWQWSP